MFKQLERMFYSCEGKITELMPVTLLN